MKKQKNLKRLLRLILISTLLLTPILSLSVSAEENNSCGTSATWAFDSSTGTLTISGTGAMSDYTAGTTPWYDYRTQITAVVIENGITSIGNYAFNECALTSIDIPNSVTTIGGYAFRLCKKLTAVTIGSGVTEIGSYAFNGCSTLGSMVIPGNVKTIKSWAFNNCTKMPSVTLEEGLETIVHGAFNNCTSLTEIVLPSTVAQIGTATDARSAFQGCTALADLTFLSSATTIYPANADAIPATAIIHGYANSTASAYATGYNRSFKELSATDEPDEPTAPANPCGVNATWSFNEGTGTLTISGTGAMYDYAKETSPWYDIRTSITGVIIEDGITAIGDFSFNECRFTSVKIPDSVTLIGDYAFRSCSLLADITLGGGLETIATYAFNGCAITSIVIPKSVKTISNFAFNNCQKMTQITLSEGLEKIGRGCFTGCKMLTGIVFPSTVKEIGDEGKDNVVFRSCTSLTDVTFLSPDTAIYPDSAEAIPTNAVIHGYVGSKAEAYAKAYNHTFKDLSEPEEPEDPYSGVCGAGVTWTFDPESGTLTISGTGGMNDYAKEAVPWYEYRTEITKVEIGDSVFSIGSYAFNETAITGIEIPNSVAKIGGYAFRLCKNLARVTIGNGVVEIGTYAFNACSSLESIVVPGNVKNLLNWVFNGCSKLASVTLEEGVTEIGYGTFNNCSSLVKIVFPSTMTQMGVDGNENAVFGGCDLLTDVTFLSKDTAIYPSNADTIPATVTIHGYADSTAQAYASEYDRSFVLMDAPFAFGCTTVFELSANALKADAGEFLSIVSLTRKGIDDSQKTLVFLSVDENGALYLDMNDTREALYDVEGNALILADTTSLTVIYNDKTGVGRFYVNGSVPFCSEDRRLAVNLPIASEDFLAVFAISDELLLADGVALMEMRSAEDAAAKYAGFQVSADTTTLRILAGIDSLYYSNIGFEISLYSDTVLQSTKTVFVSSVYTSLLADGQTVTAASCGYNYLAAVEIANIDRTDYPADADVYFAIKPFSSVGGEKLYGREKRITVSYDNETKEQIYAQGLATPFIPALRFVATSDIHFTTATGVGAPRFQAMIEQLSQLVLDESKNDGYAALDAVLMAGDITETGTAKELEIAKNYLDANLPEDIELVITMGNHDWINWFNLGADGALTQFETVFGDSTADTVIGGYHFITINCDAIPKTLPAKGYGNEYSEAVVEEAKQLIEAAIAEGGIDKPIFVIQHIPPVDTVKGSEDSPWITIGEMLSEYPNLVVFAGHSHFPLVDNRSIHQGEFTTVGTGALSEVAQVHLVEVDVYGRTRIRHYSSDTQSFVGDTWMIDSYDPDDFVYTNND